MNRFDRLITRLKQHYGEPALPPATGPFELVLWENACYLLPDERRFEVFSALRDKVGLNPTAIDAASDGVLLPIALRGGMRPAMRVFRWREIARITLNQFAGDLNSILTLPYADAKKALKQFPTIGDPGRGKDPAALRGCERPADRIEWPSGTEPVRVGAGAAQLRRHLSVGAGRPETRTAGPRGTAQKCPPPAARPRKDPLQGEGALVPSVSGVRRVSLCTNASPGRLQRLRSFFVRMPG